VTGSPGINHELRWCSCRREQATPAERLDLTEARFLHGRHLGQGRHALRAGHCQRTQLALLMCGVHVTTKSNIASMLPAIRSTCAAVVDFWGDTSMSARSCARHLDSATTPCLDAQYTPGSADRHRQPGSRRMGRAGTARRAHAASLTSSIRCAPLTLRSCATARSSSSVGTGSNFTVLPWRQASTTVALGTPPSVRLPAIEVAYGLSSSVCPSISASRSALESRSLLRAKQLKPLGAPTTGRKQRCSQQS